MPTSWLEKINVNNIHEINKLFVGQLVSDTRSSWPLKGQN